MASRPGPSRPAPAPYPINSFRDALGLAFELAETRGPGRYGHLADRAGRPLGLVIRRPGRRGDPPRWHHLGPPPEAAWASLLASGGSLLVVSVLRCRPGPLGPVGQRAYLARRAALARQGMTLHDWIRTDGDGFTSAAHQLHPATAWPLDPPADRRLDRLWAADQGGCTSSTSSPPPRCVVDRGPSTTSTTCQRQ